MEILTYNNEIATWEGNILFSLNESYCSEALSLFARMDDQPSSALKILINKTIVDLKSAGIWDYVVEFNKMNLHNATDAALNWKSNDFNIVAVNTPTWTAKKGFVITTSKYIKSGFIPSDRIAAGDIGISDTGFLIDRFESGTPISTYEFSGVWWPDQNHRFQFTHYSSGNLCSGILNGGVTGTITMNNAPVSRDGIFYIERNGGLHEGYYEGIKHYEKTGVDEAAAASEIYFGALKNNSGNATYFCNTTLRTIILCKYLGETKQALLYNILKYFNDNVDGTF